MCSTPTSNHRQQTRNEVPIWPSFRCANFLCHGVPHVASSFSFSATWLIQHRICIILRERRRRCFWVLLSALPFFSSLCLCFLAKRWNRIFMRHYLRRCQHGNRFSGHPTRTTHRNSRIPTTTRLVPKKYLGFHKHWGQPKQLPRWYSTHPSESWSNHDGF